MNVRNYWAVTPMSVQISLEYLSYQSLKSTRNSTKIRKSKIFTLLFFVRSSNF